jgi:hypothetical protein
MNTEQTTSISAPANCKVVEVLPTASAAKALGMAMRRAGRIVFMVRAADQAVQGFAGMIGRQAALYEIA